MEALALSIDFQDELVGEGLWGQDNPTDPINDVHDKLKRFLRSQSGYARRDLQGWLNPL